MFNNTTTESTASAQPERDLTDDEISMLTNAAEVSARGHAEEERTNGLPEPARDDLYTDTRLRLCAETEAENLFDRWDDEARAAAKDAAYEADQDDEDDEDKPVTRVAWSNRDDAKAFYVETMLAEYRRLWEEESAE